MTRIIIGILAALCVWPASAQAVEPLPVGATVCGHGGCMTIEASDVFAGYEDSCVQDGSNAYCVKLRRRTDTGQMGFSSSELGCTVSNCVVIPGTLRFINMERYHPNRSDYPYLWANFARYDAVDGSRWIRSGSVIARPEKNSPQCPHILYGPDPRITGRDEIAYPQAGTGGPGVLTNGQALKDCGVNACWIDIELGTTFAAPHADSECASYFGHSATSGTTTAKPDPAKPQPCTQISIRKIGKVRISRARTSCAAAKQVATRIALDRKLPRGWRCTVRMVGATRVARCVGKPAKRAKASVVVARWRV